MSMMLSPVPTRTFNANGNVYVADQYGVIQNVTDADQPLLIAAGCAVLAPNPTDLLAYLLQANFNSTADQQLPLYFNAPYRVRRIVALHTSVNGMSTAAGGLYTGAGKTGNILVLAAQVYTGLTNFATALELTINLPNLVLPALTPIYFALTTAQGAPAAADIFVYGDQYK